MDLVEMMGEDWLESPQSLSGDSDKPKCFESLKFTPCSIKLLLLNISYLSNKQNNHLITQEKHTLHHYGFFFIKD